MMAPKKKEANDNGVSEMERLQLYNKQLKIRVLQGQIEALRQRQNALAVELDSLPKKMQEAEQQRQEILAEYQQEYAALKEAMSVPEGHEVNLETGDIINPQQPNA